MGNCSVWTYETFKAPEKLLSLAKEAAKEHGIEFKGNAKSGTVSGKGVKGWYKVSGKNPSKITIKVTDKPWYASCGMVKGKMDKAAKEFL